MLSPKQLYSIAEPYHRYYIWVGSVSSGKTFASIIKLIDLLKNGTPGDAMLIGLTRDTLQRNVLYDLFTILGAPPPSSQQKHVTLFGRRVYLVGASNEGSSARIQGATLSLAYVDEAAKIPESFFVMLDTRLRKPNSCLLATCNPESPAHWLKKNYLDRSDKIDVVAWSYTLEDNPSLDGDYIKSIKESVSGVWYKRLILGQWAVAEGAIYDMFNPDIHVLDEVPHYAKTYLLGIDYGTTNPFGATLIGFNDDYSPALVVEKEIYYDSSKTGITKTDSQYGDMIEAIAEDYPISKIYLDPSAISFETELRRRGLRPIKANNAVLDGIRCVANLLYRGDLKIVRSCKHLIDEMQGYVWDTSLSEKGKEAPLKKADHLCDATRYLLFSHFGHRKYLKTAPPVNKEKAYWQRLHEADPEQYPVSSPGWHKINSGFF